MDLPICDKCGGRHWSIEPCEAADPKPAPVIKRALIPYSGKPPTPRPAAPVRKSEKVPFDRIGYMREYMRTRRQRAKEGTK